MFSVDFSESVKTKSNVFSFSLKKLPLEALGSSAFDFLSSEQFCQNGRLGPPESEEGSGSEGQKVRKS